MIVNAGLTSGQIQMAGLLGLALACSAAFALAFVLVAEARRRGLGWAFACVGGLVAGTAAWATLVLLRLIERAPTQTVDVGMMLAALVLAVAGGIGAMTVLVHRAGEWPRIGSGLVLGASLPAIGLVVLASGARIAELDAVAFVIATVCTLSAAAAAMLISEMGLGRWRIPVAAVVMTLAVLGAHYGGGRAAALPSAVSEAEAAAVVGVHGVLAAVSIVLALAGAASAVAMVAIARRRRIEADEANRRAAEDALAQRLRTQLGPLVACLDLMSSETLPLSQRARLDIARACAGDLESMVGAADAREAFGTTGGFVGNGADAAGPCVLVVDEAIHRAVTGEMLRRLGARVALAANAAEALASLAAAPFDLALVNGDMPSVDAFGLAEAIRANPVMADVVVVGLSANPAEDRAEADACGMDDIVANPLTPERLVALLERWVPCEGGVGATGDGVAEVPGVSSGGQLFDLARARGARGMVCGPERMAAIGEVAVGARAR